MEQSNRAILQQQIQAWLEHSVIGLNLCPFAKAVYVKNQIRYTIIESASTDLVAEQLLEELAFLQQVDPKTTDTTLLICPNVFADFMQFNEFVDFCHVLLDQFQYSGVLQIAHFHPQFQFEQTRPSDLGNMTNWAPCPILHLLREASVQKAVDAFPQPEAIFEANIATLEQLGQTGWLDLKTTIMSLNPKN